MRRRNITNTALAQLTYDARKLAMIRSMDEWRSKHIGWQRELASFVDQVEELLATSDDTESNFPKA